MSTVLTSPLPTSDALRARVQEALAAVGASVPLGEPGSGGLPASTPITGDVLFSVPSSSV
ncbi:aldehyde dehydrogenase family protein, partial [Mycobacterium sp. ITM-2017-0098]